MSGAGEDDGPLSPILGVRLSTLPAGGGGKWQTATVAQQEEGQSLPFCLHYDTGGATEWVRFVSSNVLEAWPVPKASGKRRHDTVLPPAGAATVVRAFVVQTKRSGRPSKAAAEAKQAAAAAAVGHEQQRNEGQRQPQQELQDGGGSSPAKKPRLMGPPAAASAAASDGQQRPAAAGAAPQSSAADANVAVDLLPAGSKERLQIASPAVEGNEREAAREAASPLGEQHTAAVLSSPGVCPSEQQQPPQGEAVAGDAQPQQQTADPPAGAAAAHQQAAGAPSAAAGAQQQQHAAVKTTSEMQLGDGQEQQADTEPSPAGIMVAAAAAAVLPAVAAESFQPKRPAVTELGMGTFTPLATVPVEDDAASPGQSARPEKRRSASGAAPTAAGRQPARGQSEPSRQQQHERPRSRISELPQPAVGGSLHPAAEQEEAAAPAEPAPERPGDIACRQFAALLPGLTGFKESITAAATAAINAGQLGNCKEAVRSVLEHMQREQGTARRVIYFYLLDAVLAHSRKEVEGCGPESMVGNLFPRAVGAALSQLVDLLGASLEGARKMEKTLCNTWSAKGKRGVEASLVQRALQRLRERIAQHQAAWGEEDAAPVTVPAATAQPAFAAGPGSGAAAGHEPGMLAAAGAGAGSWRQDGAAGGGPAAAGGQLLPVTLDEAGLWQLFRKTPMRAAPLITFLNIQDGSKVKLTHAWQADAWPEYSSLPLPHGAESDQCDYQAQQLPSGGAAAPKGDTSPWHAGFADNNSHNGAVVTLAQQQQQQQGLQHDNGHAAALAEQQRMARAAAQMAMAQAQRLLFQQQLQARGQSTAAAAEADEFDAGLFKEAAGGVGTSGVDHHQQLQMVLTDLLQPMGDAPWASGTSAAGPPLPNQPPPQPEHGWALPSDGGQSDEEDEEGFGPPPLPPHSPPRDEYEMETDGDTPPPLPPPEDEEEDQQQQQQWQGGQQQAQQGQVQQQAGQQAQQQQAQQQQVQQQAAQQQQQQHDASAPAAPSGTPAPGYQPWPRYSAADYGAAGPQQQTAAAAAAAYRAQQQVGWQGGPGAASHPLMPPGIGVAAASAVNPSAAMVRQQQMWLMYQQQQQAALMGGMHPHQPLIFSPAMTPIHPHLLRQQQVQQSQQQQLQQQQQHQAAAGSVVMPHQLAFTPGAQRPCPPLQKPN